MIKAPNWLVVILVLIFSLGISSAEIYKWVDENGVTHYSDSPTQSVPESTDAENDDIQSLDAVPADQPTLPDESPKITLDPDFFDILDKPQEETVAAQTPTVEIYEPSWCGYCKKAIKFFRSRGIEPVVYDIEKDREAARRMFSMTNRRAVPYVVINGQGIQGYSEQAYAQALEQ